MKPTRRLTKTTIPDPAETTGQPPATSPVASNPPRSATLAKLTVRMDADDLGRARSAWRIACAHSTDYPTFGQWAATALMAATEAVEADHNGGHPLDPTPAGVIPTGNATR